MLVSVIGKEDKTCPSCLIMAERFSGTRVTLADAFSGDVAADREVHSVLTSVRVISPPESKVNN